ncbi:phosphate/phosphite/phosphonate ABC transporter substrate-binding protein [Agaribacter flavus]|uniref:Phosphate/phosphite/phosphonate ABC transporter substrate-binding protein n=1 Tax=Agaribacter flavus TaxID=1902781 RepID=A0ABV7FMY2_9ALTE
MKSRNVVLLGLMFFTCFSSAETLVFGVVPQQSAKKLAESWAPMMAHLSEKTGKQIVFATAKDIPTFESRLAKSEYDIAYMNPYHFVVFSERSGYRALARQKNKRIRGIIVVPKASNIQSLADLQGATLAFPAPAAFAATIIPQSTLAAMGIAVKAQYVSSHDSVYLNVSRNIFPAGGGVLRTFNATRADARENLRILWKSPGYTPHAIATAATVDEQTRAALLYAMLNLNDDSNNQALLKGIAFSGFEKGQDKDWEDVRKLGIDRIKAK